MSSDLEAAIDRIEAEWPKLAGLAFHQARQEALDAGLSVLHSEGGMIYEVFPSGYERPVKQIALPFPVQKGMRIILQ